jgi:hypothetical protein
MYMYRHLFSHARIIPFLAAAVCSVTIGLAVTSAAPAEAAVEPCITVNHHWPLTDVTNNCSTTKKVVIHFWSPPWWYHDSGCLVLRPGETKTLWNAAPSTYEGADYC